MPALTALRPGAPIWIDLSCDDVEAAGRFYGEVVGFEAQPGNPDFGGWAACTKAGKQVCAMMPKQDPSQPTGWTTYLHTDDAEATAAAVREAGGQVLMEPMAVADFGSMAVCADPTGAVFGLWQPGTHRGAELVNEDGTWCWAHCNTPDPERAAAFYREVFGIEVRSMDMGGMEILAFFDGDRPIAGVSTPPGEAEGTWWSTDFQVPDVDAATERAKAQGAEVLMEPFDFPFGRNAILRDPQGAPVGLFTPGE